MNGSALQFLIRTQCNDDCLFDGQVAVGIERGCAAALHQTDCGAGLDFISGPVVCTVGEAAAGGGHTDAQLIAHADEDGRCFCTGEQFVGREAIPFDAADDADACQLLDGFIVRIAVVYALGDGLAGELFIQRGDNLAELLTGDVLCEIGGQRLGYDAEGLRLCHIAGSPAGDLIAYGGLVDSRACGQRSGQHISGRLGQVAGERADVGQQVIVAHFAGVLGVGIDCTLGRAVAVDVRLNGSAVAGDRQVHAAVVVDEQVEVAAHGVVLYSGAAPSCIGDVILAEHNDFAVIGDGTGRKHDVVEELFIVETGAVDNGFQLGRFQNGDIKHGVCVHDENGLQIGDAAEYATAHLLHVFFNNNRLDIRVIIERAGFVGCGRDIAVAGDDQRAVFQRPCDGVVDMVNPVGGSFLGVVTGAEFGIAAEDTGCFCGTAAAGLEDLCVAFGHSPEVQHMVEVVDVLVIGAGGHGGNRADGHNRCDCEGGRQNSFEFHRVYLL